MVLSVCSKVDRRSRRAGRALSVTRAGGSLFDPAAPARAGAWNFWSGLSSSDENPVLRCLCFDDLAVFTMSTGPLATYDGVSGVADPGGDSMAEDLNLYYSVSLKRWRKQAIAPVANIVRRPVTSRGS